MDKNPTFDGRETVIAILDTGVDPGAVGLQKTTTGETKCIHLIDCTGAGDVACTTLLEPTIITSEDGSTKRTLQGLTGRTLSIPDSWVSRDGKFRLGWKSMDGLFPDDLVSKMKQDRKRKFLVEHNKLLVAAQEKVFAHEKTYQLPDDIQKLEREDLKSRIEVLKEQMEKYSDPGMVFDCVVFHDGA